MINQLCIIMRINIIAFVLISAVTNSALAVRDIIITSGNSVMRFDGFSGSAKGYFIQPGTNGLISPAKMIIGPDGKLYIADSSANVIKRFDMDGVFIDNFVPAGYLANPVSLKFGPDGKLYVLCGGSTRQIHRFNGTTGVNEGLVVNALSTQINNSKDFTFMPSTNDFLIVSGLNSVARFNFTTGAFISHYLNSTRSSTILSAPTSIIFGPDGNYWVTSSNNTNKITRFSISTGAKIDNAFNGPTLTAGHHEQQLENGFLFVANGSGNDVIAYDAYAYLTSPASRLSAPAKEKIKKRVNLKRYKKMKARLEKKDKSISQITTKSRSLAAGTGDGFDFIVAGSQGLANPKNMLFVDINDPPVANAGIDSTVAGGEVFVLNGSGSYDPEGSPISVQWSQLSGPTPIPVSTPSPSPSPNPSSSPSESPVGTAAIGSGSSSGTQPVIFLRAPYMPAQMEFRLDVSDGIKSSFDTVNFTITAFEDLDNDGMPDRWEEANGLDKNVNDAASDLDGDGQKNSNEFLAGTNPNLNSSSLRVLEYKVVTGGFSLRFTSVVGRHYEIQSSTNLTSWSVVPGLEDVIASGIETTVVDTRPMVSSRFYRIAVKPIGF